MADIVTPEKRSLMMAGIKGKNTKPELVIRSGLHALGYRYRIHVKDLPGKPDLVFPKYKAVLFVHGCFWHGHDCPRGSRVPKANRDYWLAKVARNTARDQRNRTDLEAAGWQVETVWECQMKDRAALKARLAARLK